MKGKVYFRADGNSAIGLGHVTRSLAVAQMLSGFYDCCFIIQEPSESLKREILGVCKGGIIELSSLDNYGEEANFLINNNYFQREDVIVLDGYNFNTEYQTKIKQKVRSLLCIDDNCGM